MYKEGDLVRYWGEAVAEHGCIFSIEEVRTDGNLNLQGEGVAIWNVKPSKVEAFQED